MEGSFSLGNLKTYLVWDSSIIPNLRNRYLIIYSANYTNIFNYFISSKIEFCVVFILSFIYNKKYYLESNNDYSSEKSNITTSKGMFLKINKNE